MTSETRPLIPGWELVPQTPPELREPWEVAKELLRGQINRLAFRAFVEPAQLLAFQALPAIAQLGIIPSAELFYTRQAEEYVTAALRSALGAPVELELLTFRHEPEIPPEAEDDAPTRTT